MKAKRVTVCFDYTNFDVLESMLERLKDEITQGREYFENDIHDCNGAKRYLQFMQEYKKTRNFVIDKNVITIKSNI